MHETLPVGFAWEFDCEGCPLKEQKLGEMSEVRLGNVAAKDAPEREKERGRISKGKWGKKLQKLSFLKLVIMRKMLQAPGHDPVQHQRHL